MLHHAKHVVGPIMYRYTLWVVLQARKMGIKNLWFLARDGYLLNAMAERVCRACGIDIKIRYLYCSRRALRMPTYHLIGDEAYEYLLSWGYYCTPRSVLARAELVGEDGERLLSSIGFNDPDERLSRVRFDELCRALRENGELIRYLKQKSEASYPAAMAYLKQEGLFDTDTVAIVDSGWTGSMQHSLRVLLESGGYGGRIIGFYFGMYAEPRCARDGEFLTYYFNASGPLFRKLYFNNNVFECMLSAPHPMTVSYVLDNGVAAPTFASYCSKEMLNDIELQIKGALEYADEKIKDIGTKIKADCTNADYYKLIKQIMIYPTKQQAQLYSHFLFCDDVTESYMLSIIKAEIPIRRYTLPGRIIRKITGRGGGYAEPLWIYGAIADMSPIQRAWYRLNALIYDFLKALKAKIKIYLKR